MAKVQHVRLEDEEIKIDIEQKDNDKIVNIIMRNSKNEDTKYSMDLNTIIHVKDLIADLKTLLNLNDNTTVRMFFKGRPFKDENKISDFKLTNCDVILYMLVDLQKSEDNEVLMISENLENDLENNSIPSLNTTEIMNRGFNRFRDFGIENNEIHVLRVLFHTAHISNIRQNVNHIDWSPESVIVREEDWLNSNNPSFINANNQFRDIPFGFFLFHNRRGLVNRMRPILRDRNRDFNREFNEHSEPDSRFFSGLASGLILNFFAIIFLMFFNFRPKFKIGMQLGMVIGALIVFLYFLKK